MRISFYAITQIVLIEIPMIVKCDLICKQYLKKKRKDYALSCIEMTK